jgi:GAF domain-containing protein/anti-sigma regulatory factor (Ser/Thr protein kinase)
MPSEVSTVSGDHSVEELRNELAEAREQQAATAEILRVISSSPTNLQRMFAVVAASAARLCDAYDATIFQLDGDLLRLVANHGSIPQDETLPLTREVVTGRAVLDGRTIQVADVQAETGEYPEGSDRARRVGHRTILAVPLIRAGKAIGVIAIRRTEVRPFTDRQIDLVTTFANQAVIAIENARLFEEVQARTKELQARSSELTQSLEYQTAISDVLAVISRSKFDLQPVLDTLASVASRLCVAEDVTILLKEGADLRSVAHHSSIPFELDIRRPIGRGWVSGRAVVDRKPIHVDDVAAAGDEFPLGRDIAIRRGHRTSLGIPLLREDEAIGCIILRRTSVRPFAEKQIALLQTFADQAVIAIENARLFEAEQASKRELQESLEYQTATSEVLGVISRSPTELQPVLDSIAATAARLCESVDAQVYRVQDGKLAMVAQHGTLQRPGSTFPGLPLTRGSVTGRAVLDRQTIHVDDLAALVDSEYPDAKASQTVVGHRTTLATPLLMRGESLGAILLRRTEVRPFSERQRVLLQTFADQAVIAIENARLFEAEQARTRDLQEALEHQTATGEMLSVISRSTFDVQPVLEAVIESATKLCGATRGHIFQSDGEFLRFAAAHGAWPGFTDYLEKHPLRLGSGSLAGTAASERRPVHALDVMAVPDYRHGELVRQQPYRTALAVPMLREDAVLGVICILKSKMEAFTDKQIKLVETFADQAVIAIENVRLFEEVQARTRELSRSVAELRSLGQVGQTVSSSLELKVVLARILEHACAMSDTRGGAIYVFDKARGQFDLEAGHNMSEELIAAVREHPIRLGESSVGQCAERREAVQLVNLADAPPHPLYKMHIEWGVRALLAVPLLHQDEVIGALVVRRRTPGEFPAAVVELMQTLANQSAIAIHNARLFRQLEEKGRELELASQHKSRFVANMSHELRTPLAAILGYAELIQEGFYGPQPEKTMDALTRIRSNGKHLLGLINTVLDIAKIESGQFTLNMVEYAIESVVETVRAATESLAQNKNLALKTEVAKKLPIGLGDEQRLTQVLLNLVGNAIKFTDAGEVLVSATSANGNFAVSVSDTGPGIPEVHQARIFEQFHQVDSSNTKAKGGTGLGLAIAKQIVEMHGGRIWVESTLGKGATFQMELPVRAEFRKGAPAS